MLDDKEYINLTKREDFTCVIYRLKLEMDMDGAKFALRFGYNKSKTIWVKDILSNTLNELKKENKL